MRSPFQTAQGYLLFDKLIRKAEGWLASTRLQTLGYSQAGMAQRLAQRLVEVGLFSFVQQCAAQARSETSTSSDQSQIHTVGGIRIDPASGQARPSAKMFFTSMIEFHVHWLHALATMFLSLLLRRPQQGAATLLFGVGTESLFQDGGDARFVAYCQKTPVTPLQEARRLIIQTALKAMSSAPERLSYARLPLFGLLRENPVGPTDFLRLVANHVCAYLAYWYAALRHPLVSMVGRDFAYHAIAAHLNRKKLLDAVLITNSNYPAQPLWMSDLPQKNFETHLVWYAQNTVPIVSKHEPIRSDVPNYRHLRVDVSWVWSNGYADYLRSLHIRGAINVVGPIVWQLPPDGEPDRDPTELVIAIYDVTPISTAYAESIGLFDNYYSVENMVEFIDGIEHARQLATQTLGRNVRVMLKHKRAHHANNDNRYAEKIARAEASGQLEVVPHTANMYSMVAKSDLVIVIPYSSPVYVAEQLGISAIFFDPSGAVLPLYEKTQRIHFASGREELAALTCDLLTQRIQTLTEKKPQ